MKLLNKRGPRSDSCGTPKSILHHLLELLFIFTLGNRPKNKSEQILLH